MIELYKRLSSVLGLEVCFHYQVNGDERILHLRAWAGVSDEVARQIERLDFGQAVCGAVALERRPIVAEDVQHSSDPIIDLIRSLGVRAYICHPLIANGSLLGTLSFGTRTRARFEPEEVELLQTLCEQVAFALDRRRLREQLIFQASLLDHVRNGVIATDPEGKIVYWNRAAEAMYQWKASEVMGRNIFDVTVPPAERSGAASIMTALGSTGHWEGEFRVQRKDGSTFPAFVSDAVVRSNDGSVLGYVGVSTDLTEQKRAEEALRESEEKYRRIVETAAEGLWIIDAGGRTTYVNQRMAEILGYELAEMHSAPLTDLVSDEDRAASELYLDRRRHGISEQFELRLRRKDGSAIWTRISASPLHDEHGNFLGALRMVTDITDRKRAQQRAEEAERKFRRLVDSNIIGVVTADDERILDSNDLFLEMVGYTREDLRAGKLRWPEMTPPEYAGADRIAIGELRTFGACRPFAKEFYRKDGTRVPVVMGAAFLNEKPEWICFVLDLTERKKAEDALREVQKFESLGFLAGGVAHNINNLLVGIVGGVSLVLESPRISAADRELLEEAMVSGERAASLTSQLLAYAGEGRFTVQPIHFSTFIAGMADLFRSSISKQVDLRYRLANDLPAIETDSRQIRQMISNLVINAAEAIGDREGVIEIATRSEAIDGNSRVAAFGGEKLKPGSYIVIEVSDTGSGVDPAIRSRIFDPFFSTKFTGRGLGLAAVAGIVRSHKGAIQVISERGKGSTFRILLPVEH